MGLNRAKGCLQGPPCRDRVGDPGLAHQGQGLSGVWGNCRICIQQCPVHIEND